ncbi:MAG: diguanylate cyclase (GGDEF)-like protein/PAS domain S-box-containing protein [Sulfurimonas sp.]|jgi:diguanylate cyclase (GGDEF)-like protein/PAS domain S-box-containing protein
MFIKKFDNLKIRTKLILIFIIIKVIPVILISLIALYGVNSLHTFFNQSSLDIKKTAKEVVSSTAKIAVEDSTLAINKMAQTSLEILTAQIAEHIANFLYERDDDILVLSKITPSTKLYKDFLKSKERKITDIDLKEFVFDDKSQKWIRSKNVKKEKIYKKADLIDNQKEFHRVDTYVNPTKKIPIYKEITFFDLNGIEKIKISTLDKNKQNISKKLNTYLKAEEYFNKITSLKEGEIYVSDVIGEYVPTKLIGTYTRDKAKKAGIPFQPEKCAYAGKENPKGKKFKGIIRFVTPIFTKGKKIGYISLALDHKHIMEFTDTINPLNYSKVDIADAGSGNYAFMWDYKGRNISHPRDYFIVGFDKNTGERVPPWTSKDVYEKFTESKKQSLNDFLNDYPTYDNQSLSNKPSLTQIKNAEIGLDCRYLNFAPQCQGWKQLTENGGVGSFIILWSKIWKLTTASVIPYYTGQYGSTSRGFGIVTLGANVDEFNKTANKTKETLNSMLENKLKAIDNILVNASNNEENAVSLIVNELTYATLIMIILIILVAIWLSNHLINRLNKLLLGAKEFSNKNFSHRIQDTSKDEIGEIADSFNEMINSLEKYIQTEKDFKNSLEEKVKNRTNELYILNDKIQEELEIKTKQEEKLEIFAKIFSNTIEGIVITDIVGNIVQINSAFTKITQYTQEEIIGSNISNLSSNRHDKQYFEDMWKTIKNKKIWEGEIWNKKKDGTAYPASISIIPILNLEKEISYFVAIQHDITNTKNNEIKLHKQAYYDSLTKLANRSLGYEMLSHAITKVKNSNKKVAIVFLDLDRFKQINDTMGHDYGDLLLIEVAKILKKACNKFDTVCRLGGDEFLIVLEEINNYSDAIHVIEKIIYDVAQPILVNNKTINTSASLGVTFYPDDGLEMSKLLKNADIAMYRAKSQGRNTFEIFTKELNDKFKEAVELEEQVRDGVKNNEFYMLYQPIYDTFTKQIAGFEALMRWNKGGIEYPPSIFIEVLEETKMINEASFNIMPKTLKFIADINKKYNKNLFIAINISSLQFKQKDFNKKILEVVSLSGIKPQNVCLEITESIFLNNISNVSHKLKEIKKIGFSVALDDFGTGYSSLQYIKDLPIDKIKIDKSFVDGLPSSSGDKAIISSVCSLAKHLSLELVAEGVETTEQLEYLSSLNCNYIQGYLFSKPKPENEIRVLLEEETNSKG